MTIFHIEGAELVTEQKLTELGFGEVYSATIRRDQRTHADRD